MVRAIRWIVLEGLQNSRDQVYILQVQKVTIRRLPWRLEPYAELRIPGLQQAIDNGTRQPWESPTHASGTIEVRLQGRRPLTETHAQRKAYLTQGLQ